MKSRRGRESRGYFILDAAFAVAVLAVLMTVLAVSNTQNRRAAIAMAEHRAAVRQAEEAVVRLRTGEPVEGVAVDAIDAAGGAPEGWRWVRVRVAYPRGEVSLDALSPDARVEATP